MYRHWYLCPVYHCRVRVICTLYIMRIHKRNKKKNIFIFIFILHIELFWKKGQIARRIANPVR